MASSSMCADEEFGGFGGPHAMVVGGYSQVTDALAVDLHAQLRLSCPVVSIDYREDGVTVTTAAGEAIEASAVIVTAPLGVLKAGSLAFKPPLPDWKAAAISSLGMGNLNKVVMEFEAPFWEGQASFFGIARHAGEQRGMAFMFWNLHRFAGAPLLASIVAGSAAGQVETMADEEVVASALEALRSVYGQAVTTPTATHVTRWGSDPYARGSYSFVPVGSSGRDYELLATPVGGRVMFAGEHTCREHPDTVGGAMLSGVREAARAIKLLRGETGEEEEQQSVEPAAATTAAAAAQPRATKDRKRRMKVVLDEDEAREPGSEVPGAAPQETPPAAKKVKKEKKEKAKDETPGKEGKQKEGKEVEVTKDKAKGKVKKDEEEEKDKPKEKKKRAKKVKEEEEEKGEDVAEEGDGKRRRNDTLPWQRKQRAPDEQEKMLKQGWSAVSAAAEGQPTALLKLLEGCSTIDTRETMLRLLAEAPQPALATLAGNVDMLRVLGGWAGDLVGSKHLEHLLTQLMKLLQQLKIGFPAAKASDLAAVVRRVFAASKGEPHKSATLMMRAWQQQTGTVQRKAAPTTARPRPAAAPAAPAPAAASPSTQTSSATAVTETDPLASHANGAGPSAAPAQQYGALGPQQIAAMAAIQEQMRQAQELAAAAAAQLQLAAGLRTSTTDLPHIADFSDFATKSGRARKRERGERGEHGGKSSRSRDGREKRVRGEDERERSRPSVGSGEDAPFILSPQEQPTSGLREVVEEFVYGLLKRAYADGRVGKEEVKTLRSRITDKVLQGSTSIDTAQPQAFINEKRKQKITAMVESYVSKMVAKS